MPSNLLPEECLSISSCFLLIPLQIVLGQGDHALSGHAAVVSGLAETICASEQSRVKLKLCPVPASQVQTIRDLTYLHTLLYGFNGPGRC